MKQFIQLTISAQTAEQEQLIAQLSELKAEGFEEKETELLAYFPAEDFEENTIREILEGSSYSIETVVEKNWNEEWEKNFNPVQIGNFCAVRADFHSRPADALYDIIITPKMSFGTGHHATTKMMMEQMKDIDFTNRDVLDFGTGTGVLAILAEKLGAKNVKAIDVDEWSIRNATENIEKNICNKITLEHTTRLPASHFDIILANINRNVLLEYAEALKKITNPNGYLLVSGIMIADELAIVEAFVKEFDLVKRTEKDGWISVLFIRLQ